MVASCTRHFNCIVSSTILPPIAFSHNNNAYGLALHAYKDDIVHDHVHRLTPALMCLIRHLGRVSGQGPSITFEDWRDATPPPPWRDNYHEVDLLCLVAKQLNHELGLPNNKAYAYVSITILISLVPRYLFRACCST